MTKNSKWLSLLAGLSLALGACGKDTPAAGGGAAATAGTGTKAGAAGPAKITRGADEAAAVTWALAQAQTLLGVVQGKGAPAGAVGDNPAPATHMTPKDNPAGKAHMYREGVVPYAAHVTYTLKRGEELLELSYVAWHEQVATLTSSFVDNAGQAPKTITTPLIDDRFQWGAMQVRPPSDPLHAVSRQTVHDPAALASVAPFLGAWSTRTLAALAAAKGSEARSIVPWTSAMDSELLNSDLAGSHAVEDVKAVAADAAAWTPYAVTLTAYFLNPTTEGGDRRRQEGAKASCEIVFKDGKAFLAAIDASLPRISS